jgi:hypothetical protein
VRLPLRISQPAWSPNWKFRRRSSIDQLLLTLMKMPSRVSAMRSSRLPALPGRRLMFVMRMSGMWLHVQARALPMLRRPIWGAVSRLVR